MIMIHYNHNALNRHLVCNYNSLRPCNVTSGTHAEN